MPSILRIGPKVALFGVVAGLILVGWAAHYSLAQIPAQDPPPASELAPGSTVKGDVPQAAVVQTKPATDSELAAPIPPPGPADSLTIPQLKAEPSPSPFNAKTTDKSPAPVPVAPGDAASETDDPEKVASAFLEKNQKVAETHLKALRDEAEKLKTRLHKVEAGIARWESLLGALKHSQPGEVRVSDELSPPPADAARPRALLPKSSDAPNAADGPLPR